VYTQDGNIGFWVYSGYGTNNGSAGGAAGTSYIQNAAAWKIRTINLTYHFTKLISHQKIVKAARLTALCNNVLLFRPSQNNFTDPEFNYSNSNGLGLNTVYQLPPTRQFSFTINLTF
jgi:hypothetical protein